VRPDLGPEETASTIQVERAPPRINCSDICKAREFLNFVNELIKNDNDNVVWKPFANLARRIEGME
jgi:hypothetical protein